MPQDYRIRRDRSALARGAIFRGRARRSTKGLMILTALVIGAAAFVLWQFNTLQPLVLAMVGISHTPTPTILESARQGDLAFWRGDLNTSIAHYRHAAALAPDDLNIHYELIRMLVYRSYADRREDIAEAVALSDRLLERFPNHSRAFAIRCLALGRARQSEEASQLCNRALNLDPNNADAYAYLALAYYDLSRFDVAAEAALRALELNPESIEGNTAYAFILYSSRSADSAMQYFIKAAAINQRLEFPYFNLAATALGLALHRQDPELYRLAVNAYDTVLAMNKGNVKAYTGLCRAYFAMGERNLARDNCITATDLDSTYTAAWRWLGEINYLTMEYEAAIEAFDRCAALEASLPPAERQSECWVFRGLAHVQIGDCRSALPIFGDALNWVRSSVAIERINKGMRYCTGSAPEPTPQAPGG